MHGKSSEKRQELTSQGKKVTERMSEILQQFKSANTYIIVLPLHNFNIPSKLKDYMDNIMIARETFKYTENGSVGHLKDGQKCLSYKQVDQSIPIMIGIQKLITLINT